MFLLLGKIAVCYGPWLHNIDPIIYAHTGPSVDYWFLSKMMVYALLCFWPTPEDCQWRYPQSPRPFETGNKNYWAHSKCHQIESCVASLWGSLLSCMWIQMSFNQDWKTSLAEEVYPPFSLPIFDSLIFLNSWVAIRSPISCGWLCNIGLGSKATSSS